MQIVRTERFRRAYHKLDKAYQERVQKALAQFLADPTHPGLRGQRIQGTDGIWEMRAGRDLRLTFEFRADEDGLRAVVLRNVGHHDPTLKNP